MKFSTLASKFAIAAVTVLSVVAMFGGRASARVQYDPNGTPTNVTPTFNQFYDVPNGVGDEADFVRLKTKDGTNADYTSTLSAACNTGDVFTVRTYVHNGADPSQNGNGSGTAVAHDVKVAMTAPINNTGKKFDFASTVTASNTASVNDGGVLQCGNDVTLKLVPSSVQTYSKTLGFQAATDAAVNGSLKIGSQAQGSGDVWACWDDRVTVVYDVVVEKKQTPPPPPPVEKKPAVCTLIEATISNRVLTVKDVSYTANDDTIRAIRIEYGDGQTEEIATSSIESGKPVSTYTYAKDGTYTVRATLLTAANKEITAAGCAATVKATTPVTPVKPTPVCVVPKVIALKDKARTIRVEATAQQLTGATVKRYVFSFGDGKTGTVDAGNASAATEHTYAQDGTYKVTVDVVYLIDGKEVTPQQTAGCAANVAIQSTPRPPVLPDTGVGSLVGIFVATSVAGAVAHRLVWARRFSR